MSLGRIPMSNPIIKVYDKENNFITTLSGSSLSTYPSFSTILGQGNKLLNITYVTDFESTEVDHYNMVKVIGDNEKVLFRGVVTRITRNYRGESEYIDIQAIGMHIISSKTLYEYSSSFTFTRNAEPRVIIEEIIDVVNAKYTNNPFSYTTGTTTVNYGTNVNFSFDYDNCWDALQKVAEATDYVFYIAGDGTVHFHPGTTVYVSSHLLTLGNHITELIVEEESDEIVNEVYIERNGGTVTSSSDATSITNYGEHTKFIVAASIQDSGTATERITAEIEKYKNPIAKMTVVVNTNYDIESFVVGDLVTIQNIDFGITNKRIHKIDFEVDRATLHLEGFNSIEQELRKIL